MRKTRGDVVQVFRLLCKKVGKSDAAFANDDARVGCWMLDYSREKRGYIIKQVEHLEMYSFPLGDKHRSASAMIEMMSFGISLLHERSKVVSMAKHLASMPDLRR